MYNEKPNTVAVNEWEVDEIDNECYFKSTIKIEENRDYKVIKNEYVDASSINKPNTVAVHEWEVDEIDNGCYFKSTINIEENQDFKVTKNEYLDVSSIKQSSEDYNGYNFKSKTEIEENHDPTVIKDEALDILSTGIHLPCDSTGTSKNTNTVTCSLNKTKKNSSEKNIGKSRRFECNIRQNKCKTRSTIIQHIEKSHFKTSKVKKEPGKNKANPRSSKSQVDTTNHPFNCSICLKRFSTISHLKRHWRIHTG